MALRDDYGMQADSSGFLLSRRTDLSVERERLMLLRAIKADTSRIAQAVTGNVRRQSEVRLQQVARPYIKREAANAPSMSAPSAPARRAVAKDDGGANRRAVARPKRDASGRFVAGASARDDSAAEQDKKSSSVLSKMVNKLGEVAGGIKGSISNALAGTEQVDPAIAATREAGSILSPLGKPVGLLGRLLFRSQAKDMETVEKKTTIPWFKRIEKTLREIKERAIGSSVGGFLGGAGGLLSKIPGMAALAAGAAGLGGLLGRGRKGGKGAPAGPDGLPKKPGAKVPGAARGVFGKLLRRVPVLGALLAGGTALGSIFGGGDATREQRFAGAGGGIGALIGGGLGMLAGPVGAVVGATVGDIVGTKVGEWMSTVNWADVGASLTAKWDTVSAKVLEGWNWVRARFATVLDSAAQTFDGARKWLADKLEPVKEVAGKVAAVAQPYIDKASDFASPYVEKGKNLLQKGADIVTSGAEAAVISGGRLAGMLDRGYRHRENFDGIAGGANLARYGTYTNAEADRIRELKTSGANTSGRLANGMPADIRNKIIAAARANNLDPEAMLDIANIESGGNPNAISSTGALGVYQFTGKTATGVGITDRFDVDQNIQGGMKLALQNAASLRRAGLPVTRDSLYMMHQLGPSAAVDLMRGAAEGKRMDQLSALTQQSAALNVGKGSKTAAEYLAANSRALDARLGKVAAPSPLLVTPQSSAIPKIGTVTTPARVAPPTDRQQAAPAVAVPKKVASNDKKAERSLLIEQPLTQNLSDRGLAQAATGGIGMSITGH